MRRVRTLLTLFISIFFVYGCELFPDASSVLLMMHLWRLTMSITRATLASILATLAKQCFAIRTTTIVDEQVVVVAVAYQQEKHCSEEQRFYLVWC